MKTSQNGIDFIKSHEGLRLRAYRCTSGVLTVGYGHTRDVRQDQLITAGQAEQFLKEDLIVYEAAVNRFVTVNLDQYQFDALVSLCFNIGVGAFRKSTLLMVINQQTGIHMIEKQFYRWIYSAGKESRGLKKRRSDEFTLYNQGIYE